MPTSVSCAVSSVILYEKQLEVLPVIDKEFVKANLSPGGSADLLALTYFLYEIYHTTILF